MSAVRVWAATGAVKGHGQDRMAGLLPLAVAGRKSMPLQTDYSLPGLALWMVFPYNIYLYICTIHI